MNKVFIKRWTAVICCLIIAMVTIFQPIDLQKVKAADSYYFMVNGNPKTSGSEVSLTQKDNNSIYLSGSDGVYIKNFDPSTIKWSVNSVNVSDSTHDESALGVITLTNIDNSTLSANIKVKGPGYATIRLFYKDNDGYAHNYSLNVKVEFGIKYTGFTNALITGNDFDKNVMVFNNVGETKDVEIKYSKINPEDLNLVGSFTSVSSSDPSVVVVQNGVAKAVGAGVATVTITTNTASGDSKTTALTASFKAIVTPRINTAPPGGADGTDYSAFKYETDTIETKKSITFYTNSKDASKIIWKFYRDTTTGPQLIANPAGIISYTASETDGTFTVNNAKSGKYIIMGFADNMYIPDKLDVAPGSVKVPYIKIHLNVNPDIPPFLVMNVNDTYDLGSLINPLDGVYTYYSDDTSIAGINSQGILTARKSGNATITISKDDGTKYVINLTVIDGISLNLTEANIYISGTLQLLPTVTSDSTEVKWYSVKDPTISYDDSINNGTSIATVSNNGLVTGAGEGTAYIVAAITTGGVTKKAVCKVTVGKTITQITIDPAVLSLNMAESYILKAKFDPTISRNVPVKWISTDEKVVKITNSSSELVNITAQSQPGSALIIAVNTENYIIGSCKVTVKQQVSGITLSATNLSLMKSAGTYQLKATVTPSDATNTGVSWKSTNPSVATVNDSGLITLLSSGSTSIIVTSLDNPNISAVCNLTVGVPITAIKLDDTKKIMYTGDTAKLSYTITPTNATNTDVTWSTSDASVASVDAKGNIKAQSAGTAVITLRTADGLSMSSCTIIVKEKATGLAFDVTSLELYIGKTYTIKVTPTPATATDYTLTWSSLDATIASVDSSGTITAKAAGRTMITATTSTGSVLYCTVTVKAEATGLQLNYKEKTVVIGDYFDLKATIKPSSAASEESIVWVSSKTSVATVSANGRVKGKKGGTAVITCKTTDGKFTTFCTVTVVERVTSVTLNKSSYKLGLGRTYTLVAKVKTNAANNPKLKWTSSNSRIVTVDQKGNITGRRVGTVTVTAAATDGSGEKAKVRVRVVRSVSYISLNRTSVTTVAGRSFKLKATVKPKNATFKTVNWKSSDETIAIVDASGKVTALKAGNVTVKASAKDNSGKYAISYVIVQPRVPANSVTILNQNLTMVVGETAVLQKAINPSTSTDGATWATDNKTVATVTTSGKLTANKPGIANVSVMTESGKTATTKVTVVGLNTTNLVLEQYTDYTLMVLGITSGVTWDIMDSNIAVVNNGVVSTRRVGTTTIIATVNGRRLTCSLKVTKIK